ncbi:hypothetical protein E5Q_03288 [Mixia osmundae IAM 14324]|uniref:Secreted protein n=1 Tax=Mixia osmundae (strain CBS 9802 / IAM 14324 / JCM 22182 / KY 12970) TaxID=764103 RepID=G7E1A8_MIXOS|nr:hypothetical protein E5Q_03288 [Mixia osmundae IAM 14324]
MLVSILISISRISAATASINDPALTIRPRSDELLFTWDLWCRECANAASQVSEPFFQFDLEPAVVMPDELQLPVHLWKTVFPRAHRQQSWGSPDDACCRVGIYWSISIDVTTGDLIRHSQVGGRQCRAAWRPDDGHVAMAGDRSAAYTTMKVLLVRYTQLNALVLKASRVVFSYLTVPHLHTTKSRLILCTQPSCR